MDYPYGYSGQRKTMDEIERMATIRRLHPEVWRRLKAMMVASQGRVGVGTAWRDPAQQDAERARRLRTGTGAQMAPSNKSWHCAGAAVDVVGDQHWAKDHCHEFGLYYATWAGESLWHQQPIGLPHARPAGAQPGGYLQPFPLPRQGAVPAPQLHPVAPPTFPPFVPERCEFSLWPFATDKPTVRIGSHHESIRYLQAVLKCKASQRITAIDGGFGPQTLAAVRNLQRISGLRVDGIVAAQTWAQVDRLAGS